MTQWTERLAELAERHHVPGATLGISHGEQRIEAAYGVLNLRTGVPVTTDSLFQIGSITKVWTATLVMQLVQEGKIQLDAPLVEVMPELRLHDPKVTMRHLLTHTSGIDGDVFTDTGRGDDCLEKYAAELAGAAQIHPLEATWSYCNSGFSLAGRVVEKLTGGTWDAALRERIITPLGLEHTVTLPEEALMHRAAAGHVTDDGKQVLAPVWGIPRSAGPAGAIVSTVGDVLRFAVSGTLPEMAEHQVDLPQTHLLGDSWGLGWERLNWGGHRLIGHDGNTIGQSAFLRVLPSHGLAVTLLTNGGNAAKLYEELFREIFESYAGVPVPHPLGPPETPVDVPVSPHAGVYERASIRQEVLPEGVLRISVTGPMAEVLQEKPVDYPMVAVEPDLFVCQDPETGNWLPAAFYRLPTGEQYLHFGARATPRCAS
ncbi:serine hydrolase domain-containing protein [Actinoplanes sp. NPDC048796]|uniref:serine hydrolase domain-containing protein n=1 Tax=unclassified Actinoplanes TaxID=2626549 RepID=UPI0033CEEC35